MSKQDDYVFDDVDSMMRDRDIEGKSGTELGLPNGSTLIVLCASDANPRWKTRSMEISNELGRLRNAGADNRRVREWLSRIFAECLVIDWRNVKGGGVDIPFSVEACTAYLRKVDDAYEAVDRIVWETKNFRGQRIKAVVAEGNA